MKTKSYYEQSGKWGQAIVKTLLAGGTAIASLPIVETLADGVSDTLGVPETIKPLFRCAAMGLSSYVIARTVDNLLPNYSALSSDNRQLTHALRNGRQDLSSRAIKREGIRYLEANHKAPPSTSIPRAVANMAAGGAMGFTLRAILKRFEAPQALTQLFETTLASLTMQTGNSPAALGEALGGIMNEGVNFLKGLSPEELGKAMSRLGLSQSLDASSMQSILSDVEGSDITQTLFPHVKGTGRNLLQASTPSQSTPPAKSSSTAPDSAAYTIPAAIAFCAVSFLVYYYCCGGKDSLARLKFRFCGPCYPSEPEEPVYPPKPTRSGVGNNGDRNLVSVSSSGTNIDQWLTQGGNAHGRTGDAKRVEQLLGI
ncbi:MAG: hypothetical protein K0R63_375 [Rickettsiales bacterium]|jgi:hypothetical protein|nr:hypothetical protein [Rickettsiales bacterium]